MQINVLNIKGDVVDTLEISDEVFAIETNFDAV